MSGLTRSGTIDQSRETKFSRANGVFSFPAGHEHNWQPCQVEPYSAESADHTYIHIYIHTWDGNGDESKDSSGDGNGDEDNRIEDTIGDGGRESKKRKKPQNS